MMFESARSLQSICFDFICDHIFELCEIYVGDDDEGSTCLDSSSNLPAIDKSFVNSASRLRFKRLRKNDHVILPSNISESILSRISEKDSFFDIVMTLFDSKTTRLKRVKLKEATRLSMKGFMILKQHDVVDLEVNRIGITINDLMTCLNDWSLQNLRSLSVANSIFVERSSVSVFLEISNLPGLQGLNVSGTKFNCHDLAMVVENLPHLESLDISSTRVDDVTPLKKCSNRLKTLVMRNLETNTYENAQEVFLELNELRTLDISVERAIVERDEPLESKATDFLRAVDSMPHLTSLDLSGTIQSIWTYDLNKFIQAHPRLSFLGLNKTDICYMQSLINPSDPDYRPDLIVGGLANEIQIIESLKRYSDRPTYLQDCLERMNSLLMRFGSKSANLIKLVIRIMQVHPDELVLQAKACACLEHITYRERASQVHPSILHQIVDVVLEAMSSFSESQEIQSNAIMIMSNHRILRAVPFDKSRCVMLMIESLLEFNEQRLDKLCVQIITKLLSMMSFLETSKLSSSNYIIHKLLSFLQLKAREGCIEFIELPIKALRYLTNESIVACRTFIGQGGLEICFDVLKRFREQPIFNINGLFNNIAEWGELRQRLMVPEFMKILPVVMNSLHIVVGYHAAGVAAYLLSDGPQIWTDDTSMPTKTQILDQLVETVNYWEEPEYEIVTYTSFKPLLPLLRATEPYPVQLWAAWTIHHVCVTNPKRYCGMLTSENGVDILKSLEKDSSNGIQPDVRALCRSILDILALHQS